jgi:hypothetical protein
MNRLLTLLVITPLLACTHTLYEVEPYEAGEAGLKLVYSLPAKELVVEIDVTTTETTDGKWACKNAALELEPIENHEELCVSNQELVIVHEVSGVRVGEQVVPDPQARFQITLPERERGRDRNIQFTLTDDGLLAGSDAHVVDRRPEMTAAVVRTVTSIIGKVIGVATKASLPGIAKSNLKRTEGTSECPAELRAACADRDRLLELMVARDLLLAAGKEPPRRLDEEISNLQALFSTTQKKTTRTWIEVVQPKIGDNLTWEWCLETSGVLSGCNPASRAKGRVKVSLHGVPKSETASVPKGAGIRYRVPKTAGIEATLDSITVVSRTTVIPQLGDIMAVSNVVHGRRNQLIVELSASTGMLKRLHFVDEHNYSDVIDAASEGTALVLDALGESIESRQTAREAAEIANDPIEIKKRELELRELERQLACYELINGPCP